MTFCGGDDQVTRRQRFEEEHPDVRIEFRPPLWHAWVNGEVITRIHLKWLLDALGAPSEACAERTPTGHAPERVTGRP